MKVLATEISNIDLVQATTAHHRADRNKTQSALTVGLVAEMVADKNRTRSALTVGLVAEMVTVVQQHGAVRDASTAIIINPKRVSAFGTGQFSSLLDIATSNSDLQGGYYGSILNCSLIAHESVPDDVICSALVRRDGDSCRIVALETNFIAE